MLRVTTPATDATLLTTTEVAEAIGSGSGYTDTQLSALSARVSELLAGSCGLPRAGTAVLTLREETLTETLQLSCPREVVFLSRSPIVAVVSAVEAGVELDIYDDLEIASDRSVRRLKGGNPARWASGKLVIEFSAGYASVPPALKELAAKLALVLYSERGRDSSVGSVDIPGVIAETYRYGRPEDPLIPAEIMEGLTRGGFVLTGPTVW